MYAQEKGIYYIQVSVIFFSFNVFHTSEEVWYQEYMFIENRKFWKCKPSKMYMLLKIYQKA